MVVKFDVGRRAALSVKFRRSNLIGQIYLGFEAGPQNRALYDANSNLTAQS
nr:hypothetical protein [uncultured Campylobacter sp.]